MRPNPVQFRDVDVEAQIRLRLDSEQSPGRVAARDLGRYYMLMQATLPTLGLSEGEATLICEAIDGVGLLGTHGLIWAHIDQACRDSVIGKRHGLDEHQQAALVERMRSWSPVQCLACVDAVERYWLDTTRSVREVGLAQ